MDSGYSSYANRTNAGVAGWLVAEPTTARRGTRPTVYVETSIVSYLTSKPHRNLLVARNQRTTREWWTRERPRFDIYVSNAVLKEAAAGDVHAARRRLDALAPFPVAASGERAERIAEELVDACVLPPHAFIDATHIAISALHSIDFLLTGNCAHLANAQLIPRVRKVCELAGLSCPVICTPAELKGAYAYERSDR